MMFQDTQKAIEFAETLGIKFNAIRNGVRTDSVKVESPELRAKLESYGFDVNEITWYCSFSSKE